MVSFGCSRRIESVSGLAQGDVVLIDSNKDGMYRPGVVMSVSGTGVPVPETRTDWTEASFAVQNAFVQLYVI